MDARHPSRMLPSAVLARPASDPVRALLERLCARWVRCAGCPRTPVAVRETLGFLHDFLFGGPRALVPPRHAADAWRHLQTLDRADVVRAYTAYHDRSGLGLGTLGHQLSALSLLFCDVLGTFHHRLDASHVGLSLAAPPRKRRRPASATTTHRWLSTATVDEARSRAVDHITTRLAAITATSSLPE